MDREEQENISWIIKYRPKSVKDVVGKQARYVEKYIQNNNLRHLLFVSKTPGTGKSSLSKAIINDLNADYLELNSSMDRGIDSIRDKIVQFVSTMGTNQKTKKIVFLDEFDGVTKIAQDAMRNLMETYEHNVIFILTCNHLEKVIEPIQNRCEIMQFVNPDKKDIFNYLKNICDIEKVQYTDDGLNKLIDIFYPSIRRMVGELQKFFTRSEDVNVQNVQKDDEKFNKIWELFKSGKVLEVRNIILQEGLDPDLLIKFFFRQTYLDKSLTKKQQVALPIKVADVEFKMSVGSDKTIQLLSGIFEMYMVMIK